MSDLVYILLFALFVALFILQSAITRVSQRNCSEAINVAREATDKYCKLADDYCALAEKYCNLVKEKKKEA